MLNAKGRPRLGFSLIEVLVAISIIGLLLAMILPAIQTARNSARRIECANQLRQLGIALESHINTHKTYPDAAKMTIELLPYIDQTALYERIKGGSYVPDGKWPTLLKCPAETIPHGLTEQTSYGANLGNGNQAFGHNGFFVTRVTPQFQPSIEPPKRLSTPADITDGLSNTCAISEFPISLSILSETPLPNSGEPFHGDSRRVFWVLSGEHINKDQINEAMKSCQESPRSGQFQDTPRGYMWSMLSYFGATYHHALAPNSPSCLNPSPTLGLFSAGSTHPEGAHSLLGDGAVRFHSDSIDIDVWKSLGSRSSGESVHF